MVYGISPSASWESLEHIHDTKYNLESSYFSCVQSTTDMTRVHEHVVGVNSVDLNSVLQIQLHSKNAFGVKIRPGVTNSII